MATDGPRPLEDEVLLENVRGRTRAVKWDREAGRFQATTLRADALSGTATSSTTTASSFGGGGSGVQRQQDSRLVNLLKSCFIPSGEITSDYYRYSMWRLAQRFVSATCSVFGTQALLLALGFKREKIGIAAATTWVLKDALGKFSRIFWASKHGRKFDSDAKKWRFRSSIIFAAGNALEIFTYIVPSLFLLLAACANAMKQMAMLTSSATRNTIYKSFARNGDNIGDITAKGEAQLAVIDLLGMGAGILISRAIGASRAKISGAFAMLSFIDLVCIFNEIRSVVFTSLNFERAGIVLKHVMAAGGSSSSSSSSSTGVLAAAALTPVEVASREPILQRARYAEEMFKSWSGLRVDADVLRGSLALCQSEGADGAAPRFVVTAGVRVARSWAEVRRVELAWEPCATLRAVRDVPVVLSPQVLLRRDATSADVFRALVVVQRLVQLFEARSAPVGASSVPLPWVALGRRKADNEGQRAALAALGLDSATVLGLLREAKEYEDTNLPAVLKLLQAAGWDSDKFTFGNLSPRVEW
jgi:hypothetical protein